MIDGELAETTIIDDPHCERCYLVPLTRLLFVTVGAGDGALSAVFAAERFRGPFQTRPPDPQKISLTC
jgi:hypothetical protein